MSFGLKDIVIIETEERDTERWDNKKHAQKRIRRLEKAVRQLQDTVFAMQLAGAQPLETKNEWVCSLEAPFDGTQIGRDDTRVGAAAKAVQKCGSDSVFCSADKAKCEKSGS